MAMKRRNFRPNRNGLRRNWTQRRRPLSVSGEARGKTSNGALVIIMFT